MPKNSKTKIALMTFHRAINYGAILQCFALYNTLNTKYDVFVLDYRCKKIEDAYYSNGVGFIGKIKHFIYSFFFLKKTVTRRNKISKFQSFIKEYLKLSPAYNKDNLYLSSYLYDYFVVGSDQVWNLNITGNDLNYFLNFVKHNNKLSYAASFGSTTVDLLKEKTILYMLKDFIYLSIRERTHKNDLITNLSKNVFVDCDPVFLLSSDEWKNILPLKKKEHEKQYLLLYLIANDVFCVKKAVEYAKKHNLTIIFICSFEIDKKKIDVRHKRIYNAGPIEFLNFLYNASVVFTTSYHATSLSLIFNIPVYFELNSKKMNSNSRFAELISLFNLEESLIDEKANLNALFDWRIINEKINKISFDSKTRLFGQFKEMKDE